ncbi:GH1 family beta-glucosidase [Nocardioides sp. CER19]|uniref:GH1 family beta-glucosidase n=1 Tax=Nocardioides sp. CER19 TaxID=3038538 RepID=UPI002449F71D|nr:GH1 family beta-glucosidase [Nocardioides sp. CER19]MDH2412706.1 GH1 family beta-glucosidase [Nocardioides sp. CER19]
MSVPQLPEGFVFGTSTSAFQVEGAAAEDGRGPSIWDTFAGRPGNIVDGSDGSVAADHYHRLDEDLALLRRLGARGHRFSISWSRVLPSGRGAPNPKGLAFYDRLIDGLLEAGIEPMATLYHFDLPQHLEDDGGWLNRSTVDAFADYAALVADRFADRVTHWVPVSEPAVAALMGYGTGEHAPGRKLSFDALAVAHHLLLAHGRAVIELRTAGAESVGCANNHAPMWPASDDEADLGATKLFDALWNGLFLEPMLLGRYPADLAPLLEDLVRPGDLATIRQPLDFYGVNYYSPIRVAAADEGADTPFRFVPLLGHEQTASGWSVVPRALREWLILTRARFRAGLPPFVITESGASFHEQPGADGVVDDGARIGYLQAHLEAVSAAVQRGVDVRGYYVWSLLDSFEWVNGYTTPYGLVHVDRDTLERTPKRSFEWYADLIAAQAAANNS